MVREKIEPQREEVYHGETCNGQVVANFFVSRRMVEAYFVDGDIGSSKVRYLLEQRCNQFYLAKVEEQSPTPYAPVPTKTRKLKATNSQEALKEFIEYIVKPYAKPGEFTFPVNADELRKGLERALLKKEEESKEKKKN